MDSRYDEREAQNFVDRYGSRYGEDLALRVYTSRLLGADPSLVLHGGGNTSVKSRASELDGASVDVLYVKGSGWDLAKIEPEGFPACRLGPLLRYCALETMTDEQMVRGLRSQMLDPTSPTPSVEALLHAFVTAKFVDHTHADAVLSVVDQPDGEERARQIWGDDLLFVPYVMPGFLLARRIAKLGDELGRAKVMVLDKHGIFTWGSTARESYERMIEAVTKAESYIMSAHKASATLGAPRLSNNERREAQIRLSPILRGALERAEDGQKLILTWRDDLEILALLGRADAAEVTSIGTATPDHVIRTKPIPMWLGFAGSEERNWRTAVELKLGEYAKWYERYFEENKGRYPSLTRLDRLPRVILVPELGAITIGKTLADARIAGDIYRHTAVVIQRACEMGEYAPVDLADLFDVEYWSLEQAKLKVAKAALGPLERRIALVTGAARGIGRATAELFLELGAHVLVSDLDEAALADTANALEQRFGVRVASWVADVTRREHVRALFHDVAHQFGGVDIVVSNAGNAPSGLLHTEDGDRALEQSLDVNLRSHQLVARAATELMLAQGTGGALLFNASKSAFNPGPQFGPYAVAKAAVIALMRQYAIDLGAHGIRSNAINADRIHTSLFSDDLVAARSKARGVAAEEYFKQNLLHRETTARDVAEAFAYLARAQGTTGCVITVDSGNSAAFPR